MLTDRELQDLRNLGNESEAAADEIVALRAKFKDCGGANCMGQRVDGVTQWCTIQARDAAVAAERERCARACVDYSLSFSFDENDRDLFSECAQFIRTGVLPDA